MSYDAMSYEKCIDCDFVNILYDVPSGVFLSCKISGNSIKLEHCKFYYGTGDKPE